MKIFCLDGYLARVLKPCSAFIRQEQAFGDPPGSHGTLLNLVPTIAYLTFVIDAFARAHPDRMREIRNVSFANRSPVPGLHELWTPSSLKRCELAEEMKIVLREAPSR